jgi:anti-sigma-K factor RskA
MTTRSLEELRDLAPGYVMQMLTPDEQAAFDAALRDPALAAALTPELEALRGTVPLLGTAHPVAPPAALRDRVQQRIRAEAAAAPREPLAAAPPSGTPSLAPPRTPPLTVIRGDQKPSRALPIGLALAFAASALLALSLQREVQALRSSVSDQERATQQLRQQLAQRDATLRTLTDAGNSLRLVRLSPNTTAGPSLQLFWNVQNGQAVIHAAGLKPIGSDRTYQLWMIRDGKPVSVALFRPDSTGAQLLGDIPVPNATTGIAAFAVTEEPAGGSPQPTMTPFLVGAVSAQP